MSIGLLGQKGCPVPSPRQHPGGDDVGVRSVQSSGKTRPGASSPAHSYYRSGLSIRTRLSPTLLRADLPYRLDRSIVDGGEGWDDVKARRPVSAQYLGNQAAS